MSQLKLENFDYYPTGKRILIKVIDPSEKKDSLIYMPKSDQSFPQFGEVLRLGALVENPANATEASKIRPGVMVTFSRHSGVSSTIKLEDDTQLIVLMQDEIQSVMVPKTEIQNDEEESE